MNKRKVIDNFWVNTSKDAVERANTYVLYGACARFMLSTGTKELAVHEERGVVLGHREARRAAAVVEDGGHVHRQLPVDVVLLLEGQRRAGGVRAGSPPLPSPPPHLGSPMASASSATGMSFSLNTALLAWITMERR